MNNTLLAKVLLMMLLVSCDNNVKSTNDKIITPSRIGGIKMGEKYEELSKIEGIVLKEVDLSNSMFKNNIKLKYAYLEDDFKVYAQRQKGGILDFVTMIICESSKYSTENGIHVGMSIQELRGIYPELGYELKGGMHSEIGYYIPSDLVLRNDYGFFVSHVILKLNTEQRIDTIISEIIVGSD